MKITNQLYATAVILICYWAIGFFVLDAGILIHILPAISVVTVMLKIIYGLRFRHTIRTEYTPAF